MAWFAIPFGFATTLGLSAVALTSNPRFPTYPNTPTDSDITSGLTAAFAASALLGKSGAVALLIVLFMAVTSCASAELIAVSSVLTFDVYKTYIRPRATPNQLIAVSHAMICVFGITMAVFACIWNVVGIDVNWLFLVMGILISGAVFPAAFAITWRGQTRAGAIAGCFVGLAVGVVAWLVTARQVYGEITIASTGMEYPTLAGNLAAVIGGLFVTMGISLVRPDDFDWEVTRAINPATINSADEAGPTTAITPSDIGPVKEKERRDDPASSSDDLEQSGRTSYDDASLRSAFRLALISSIVLTIVMDFVIPMPMFFSHYIFSRGFFTGWVIISFLWVFASAATTCILPLWETRSFFVEVTKRIVRDLRG